MADPVADSVADSVADPVAGSPASAGAPAAQSAAGRPGRPRVVAAAVEPARRAAVVEALNRVVASGGSALLVTADGSARPEGLAPEVETVDLLAGERRLGLNRVLTRNPARLAARVTGRPAPSGPAPAWAAVRASKPYRLTRPWLLWRVLRRHLAEVRVGDVDHVIIVHQNSWPIAWQLHRRNPAISIAYEVPDEVWTRSGRRVPAVPPPSRA